MLLFSFDVVSLFGSISIAYGDRHVCRKMDAHFGFEKKNIHSHSTFLQYKNDSYLDRLRKEEGYEEIVIAIGILGGWW